MCKAEQAPPGPGAVQPQVGKASLSMERPMPRMDGCLADQVSGLLEAMNLASTSINSCEARLESAQADYKRRVEHFEKLYRALRLEYGRSFDEVRPYFHASQQLREASRQLCDIAGELSVDDPGGAESAAHCERYARALQACRDAKETLESLRARIGDAAIRSTMHCFALLERHQEVISEEHSRLQQLEGDARAAKDAYCESLRELEQLSDGMHTARRQLVDVR